MKILKRTLIATAGGAVLLAGTAMIILPGPALLVIPAGLAILGIEFDWARRWLSKVKEYWPAKKSPAAPAHPDGHDSPPRQ